MDNTGVWKGRRRRKESPGGPAGVSGIWEQFHRRATKTSLGSVFHMGWCAFSSPFDMLWKSIDIEWVLRRARHKQNFFFSFVPRTSSVFPDSCNAYLCRCYIYKSVVSSGKPHNQIAPERTVSEESLVRNVFHMLTKRPRGTIYLTSGMDHLC